MGKEQVGMEEYALFFKLDRVMSCVDHNSPYHLQDRDLHEVLQG